LIVDQGFVNPVLKGGEIMSMKKILGFVVLTAALVVFSLWGLGNAQTADMKMTQLTLLTSKFGRTSYIQGFALGEVLNKHSKWLRATAEETGGSSDNVKLGEQSPESRKSSLMVVSETPYKQAVKGEKPFDKPHPNLKIVCTGLTAVHFFGSLDPKIKTYQDMIGKKIAVGPKTDPHGIKGGDQIEFCHGILDKVKMSYMPAPDIPDAMVDGMVDVGYLTINPGYPKWMKDQPLEALAARKKVYPIPLPPDQATKAMTNPKIRSVFNVVPFPANILFEGQPATTESASFIYWCAYDDCPEDAVYEVLKMFYEHQREFVEHHALMGGLVPDKLGVGDFKEAELHKGALKFLKEKKLKIGL
jgi:hypothetical protein